MRKTDTLTEKARKRDLGERQKEDTYIRGIRRLRPAPIAQTTHRECHCKGAPQSRLTIPIKTLHPSPAPFFINHAHKPTTLPTPRSHAFHIYKSPPRPPVLSLFSLFHKSHIISLFYYQSLRNTPFFFSSMK